MNYPKMLRASTVILASSLASAQQVTWQDNPISGKVVGLTYGTSGWNAAEAQAVAYGGHLVTIRSAAENQWLKNSFASVWAAPNTNGPWIGFSDAQVEGQWRWSSNEPVSFPSPWGAGEPNNASGIEDWGHFGAAGSGWGWNDAQEGSAFRSLIELQQRPPRSWSWPVFYGTGSWPAYGILVDLDADGDLDYASPDSNSYQISLWTNDGSGRFSPLQAPVQIGGRANTIVACDWDGDGMVELIAADWWAMDRLLLIDNNGAGFQASVLTAGVPNAHGVSVADFDRDGQLEVVVARANSANSIGEIRIYTQSPNGQLVGFSSIPTPGMMYQTLPQDLNGDGYLDLLALGDAPGVGLHVGQPDGTLSYSGEIGSGITRCARAADVDADGCLELLIPRQSSGTLEIWQYSCGNLLAASAFTRSQVVSCGVGAEWVDVADLDGDGDLDAAVSLIGSENIVTCVNSSGVFSVDHSLSDMHSAACTAIGDLDGDAKPDLVTSNATSNRFAVHFNQSIFDCNGNGIDDPLDVSSGFAQDCNGNGRPDSCDLAFGSSRDSNGNGFLDECEPTLVSITPAVRPAFQQTVVTVAATNIPDGVATLTLTSPAFSMPVVQAVGIVNSVGTATLPPLVAASAIDVVAAGSLSFTDAQGNAAVTAVTPSVFTWDVPEIVEAVPSNGPFDQYTSVLFRLEDHVATSGVGSASFDGGTPQSAYLFSIGGQTYANTVAPPQAAPGPVSVLLRFGNEFTLAQRGFVYLGPGITNLSATGGWQAGGEALDVGLYGFAPGVPVEVSFGNGSTTSVVVAVPSGVPAASSVSLATPFVAASGALDLEVVQYAGQLNEKRALSPGAWLAKAPAVLDVNPAAVFQGGGESVTVTLEGFPAGQPTHLDLGSLAYSVTNTGTLDLSTVSVTTSLAPQSGAFDVTARQAAGTPTQLEATLAASLTVVGPSLLGLQPASGPLEGGTQVVANTTGFDPSQPAQVQLGGTTVVGTVTGIGVAQTVSFRTTLATADGATGVTISQGVLIATLPNGFTFDPPRVTTYCQAKLTSAGTLPVIGFTGSPSLSTGDFAITLSNALPNKTAVYFYGGVEVPPFTSFYGGKLCVDSPFTRGPRIDTDATGFVSCPLVVTPALVGSNIAIQWWFRDPADPFTVGLSRGLKVEGFYP
jgi:hypothetical protein